MFPGGGTQYVNMARDLYHSEPFFKATMDKCAALLQQKGGVDIFDLLFVDDASKIDGKAQTLSRPKHFFSVLFAVEYSLAKLWMSWGIQPNALVGHSLGEYVAATIAGVFSLEDAIGLISYRGDLFDTKVIQGGMISVSLPESQLKALLIDGVSIATINDPERCVVAGPTEAIDAFEKVLTEQAVDYKRLNLGAAGHSSLVEPAMPDFRQYINGLTLNEPTIPIVSNITGTWVDPQEVCTADYWLKHLRETVRFAGCVNTLTSQGSSIFLEVGPGNSLSSFVRAQTEPKDGHVLLNSLRHIKEEKNDQSHLLETLGKLWANGANIDWDAFYEEETRKRLPVPTYKFNSKRYWIEPKKSKASAGEKRPVDEWFSEPSWRLAEASLPSALDSGKESNDKQWLVFDDKQSVSLTAALAAQKASSGSNISIVKVEQGNSFEKISDNHYRINRAVESDYTSLASALQETQNIPNKVVHGWSIDRHSTAVSCEDSTPLNYHLRFLYLARALEPIAQDSGIEIIALTDHLESVFPADTVNPDKSLIVGPAKVIPYECGHLTMRVVDVDSASNDVLASELLVAASADEETVALRNGMRFVKSYHSVQLAKSKEEVVKIKNGGVYLITGGIGGVGMVHAEALATFNTRLALMQRSAFPEKSEWTSLLASGETDPVLAQQIATLEELESAGTEILIVEGDVCDPGSLQTAVNSITSQWGNIDGVVHCAGYGEFTSIEDTNADVIANVLAPKVLGTKNLQAVLGDNLDLMLLCSSLSSVTTGFGLIGYVSACGYLDAVAQQNKGAKTNYISINWDIWNTPQQIAKAKSDPTLQTKELKTAILESEGIDVIQRVLQGELSSGALLSNTQVVISTRDLNQLLKQNKKLSRALIDGISVDEEDDEENLALYDRPALSTPYEAPSNDLEELLVNIWQETLGISQIGVLDNFFELGGESLLGVKIVVKAKQHGLNIDPKQMFSKPTIRDAANLIEASPTVEAEQGIVTGEEVCTGIQSDFLSRGLFKPEHWNVGALFSLPETINLSSERLKAIAKRLLNHHDALRTQFKLDDSGQWHQILVDSIPDTSDWFDLSHLSENDFGSEVIDNCNALQEQFSLKQGSVFKLAYFTGPNNQKRLLILAHHLVVDAMSLSFVIEDLSQLLPLSDDEILTVGLPIKSTSFLDYSRILSQCAVNNTFSDEFEYWQSKLEGASIDLPKDNTSGKNTEADIEQLSFELDASLTSKLSDKPIKLNELLLASLGQVISGWSSHDSALIDLIGHGREPITDDVDVSRTVGWFGNAAPIKLNYSLEPLANQLPNLIQQIESVPNAGIGFNVLKYLADDHKVRTSLAHLPAAKISLNYLGDLSSLMEAGATLTAAPEPLSNLRADDNQRQYEHDIVAFVEEGCLKLNWVYSHALYSKGTIEQLLTALRKTLEALANEELGLQSSEEEVIRKEGSQALDVAPIPSTEILSALNISTDDIADTYPATPFQKELYWLNQNQNSAITNIVQGVSIVEGMLTADMLSAIWEMLLERHPILRTAFAEDKNGDVTQLVLHETEFPLQELDWSDKTEAEQKALQDQLLAQDRLTDFDLTKAPALRMTLVKLNEDETKHLILQTNHQIILDGWSSGLLAEDLATCVMASATMTPVPELDTAKYFGNYIQWLSQQSKDETKAFWQDKMSNFDCRYLLSSLRRHNVDDSRTTDRYAEHNTDLDSGLINTLKESARLSQTTINAIFQGAWALTLQQISGSDEITYGVTVSGRASGEDQVAQTIGQCTNSLPLRLNTSAADVSNTTTAEWLQTIHQENLDIQHHNLISLSEIKALAGLTANDRPYLTNVIFENIPMPADGDSDAEDVPLKITDGFWTDGWQFPLRLFVVPEGDGMWVRLAFDSGELDSSKVPALTEQLFVNLEKIAVSLNKPIASLLK